MYSAEQDSYTVQVFMPGFHSAVCAAVACCCCAFLHVRCPALVGTRYQVQCLVPVLCMLDVVVTVGPYDMTICVPIKCSYRYST